MASPSKRMRLTPQKQSGSVEQRFTQESKITSTPQRLTGKTAESPNISSIPSTSGRSRTRLSDAFSEKDLSDSSSYIESVSLPIRSFSPLSVLDYETSGAITVENYDAYIDELHGTKYKGKVWNLYKPLHEDTLYAQILQHPQDVQELIRELLLQFPKEPENVIQKLLKLCVDVCGFQNFQVSNYYIFQKKNCKEVIDLMEKDRIFDQEETLITTGRYLLMEHQTKLSKLLKAAIYSFLQKLIMACHVKGVLYEEHLSLHFFPFIKCMSFCKVRSVRHTGVVFGIKILTSLVLVYNEIIIRKSLDLSSSDSIDFRKQQIDDYLEYFYLIFVKNCRLQENKLLRMRVDCVYELSIWVKYFPKIFITHFQAFNYLFKLVTDPSKDVRFAVLRVCELFVESAEIRPFLKGAVPDFPEDVAKRFYDVDIKVSVKAVDVYKSFLKHDESLITTHRFKSLMNLVCDKYFPVGEAASQFLVSYLERTEGNDETILVRLANFSMKPGDCLKQLLVEGCLSCCSAIRNWKLYVKVLLRNDVELDIKEALAELFAEAVHQVLKGKSTVLREKSRTAVVTNILVHEKVAEQFLLFPELLRKFADHPKILLEFLKIPNIVNKAVLNEVPVELFTTIFSAVENLFYQHDDEALLRKICETFRYLSDTTHENYVKRCTDNILSKYTDNFESNMAGKTENVGGIIFKVSILFSYFDLSKSFKWEGIFDTWGQVDETVVGDLLSCCKWYLIWKLKSFENNQKSLKKFPDQIRECNEYTATCFNMLENLQGQPLHFKTYESICDFYIAYTRELDELCKSMKQFERLRMKIEEKGLENVLVLFLEKYVIHNTNLSLFQRRHYVVQYVDLVHLLVLRFECLASIFKYYHRYNKEFGAIIDVSLSGAFKDDENGFLMIVMYTLTCCYESIMNKYEAVDMTTQEAKNLKLLIKQLLLFKEFKPAETKFTKLMFFAINYAVKNKRNYAFFYFMRYFIDAIVQDDSRTEILNFLKQKVPRGAEKDDAILFLASYIKNSKTQQALQKSKGASGSKPKQNKKDKKAKEKPKETTKRATPKSKKKENVNPETDVSDDDLTIHDSESDDLEESLQHLKV